MKSIRSFENIHIPLWLMKDTCWMLDWKYLGVTMIIPTIAVAIALTVKTMKDKSHQLWVNLATCFWISANAFWMCCDFFNHIDYKNYAGIPFAMGFLCILFFYIVKLKDYYNEK